MELHLEDYLGRRRDTKRERELAARLRELPEATRFEYIQQAMQINVVVGLGLANTCLRDNSSFASLLKQGLQVADASSMSLWLETVTPHLGFRHVANVLMQTIETNPQAVDYAVYWLPRVMPKEDDKATAQYYELVQKLKDADCEQRSESEPVSAAL